MESYRGVSIVYEDNHLLVVVKPPIWGSSIGWTGRSAGWSCWPRRAKPPTA